MFKQAIDLRPGDMIIGDNQAGNLIAGTVELSVVIDNGVQIKLTDGFVFTRPEEHVIEVEDDTEDDTAN